MNNLHGIIFAYETHPGLRELTAHRNTASVPYGGRSRGIDFILSSLVNAGTDGVGLIVEAGYQSLLDHVGSGKDWDLSRKRGGLRILPPFGSPEKNGRYRGRMDALWGVFSYLNTIRQDYVVLANGDLIASLPLAELLEAHLLSGADITAVCARPHGDAGGARIPFSPNENGLTSHGPAGTAGVREYPRLEVYILSRQLLLSLTEHCAARGIFSFSGDVLGPMASALKISPWFFEGYAHRLESAQGYYACSMDLLNPAIRDSLFHPARAVKTKDRSDPSTYYGPDSRCVNSLVADGCIIEGEVSRCVLFRGVRVEKGAKVTDCILMQGSAVSAGAALKSVIADKNVLVHPGRMLMGHETYPLVIAKNTVI